MGEVEPRHKVVSAAAAAPSRPRWVPPALLLIAAIAGLSYAWRIDSASLEPFYGAAARSMSTSWHDFLFGAFDPAGTITVDKLPGAVWVQALSLRVFGFHVWAVVLPQVLEGVLTVLVLYRAVARLAGPVAGITAALLFAVSPVTIALNRGNIADTLLVLLTVLAADAASAAILNGRLRSLLLAGLWVGLAFQAKMMEAWLVLPALLAAYLLAGAGSLRRRVSYVSLTVLVALVVSLSWMSAVSLVPANERPYVDGTQNDSVFSQVFEYNGISRLGSSHGLEALTHPAAFIAKLGETGDTLNGNTTGIPPSWHRLLRGLFARDIGWLYPAALICALAVLWAFSGAGRRDPERAAVVLWGLSLLVLFVFFSQGAYINSYYVAALAPAVAALCGIGVAVAATRWRDPRTRRIGAVAVLASIAYGIYLLTGATGVPSWLIPLEAALALIALLSSVTRRVGGLPWLIVMVACGLMLPGVTSALVAARNVGPFNAPYEVTHVKASSQSKARRMRGVLKAIERSYPARLGLATYTSTLAAPYILASGEEVFPIGGFLGGVPHPTLLELQSDIASDALRTFLIPLSPPNTDPRIVWILTHCRQVVEPAGGAIELALYACSSAH